MVVTGLAYAPKGLIGLLTPQANTTVEPEFAILCSPGYAAINARLTSPARQMVDRLSEYFSSLESQIARFSNAPIDAYAFACTGSSYLAGREAERALCAKIETQTGRPFIAAARAVDEALTVLGAERIGLISPYPPELDRASTAYWTSCGFDVGDAINISDPLASHPIYGLPADRISSALDEMKGRGVDAVVLLGTGMPTLGPIRDAAEIDGPPVLSSMLALAWRTIAALDRRVPEQVDLRRWIAGELWVDRFDRVVAS
jgi:maleate cis-trans isomerase